MTRHGKALAAFLALAVCTASKTEARSNMQNESFGERSFLNRVDTIGYKPNETFRVPDRLHAAVEFWKQVYTQASTRQSIMHDNRHMQIIYGTLDFSDLYSNSAISDAERNRQREERTDRARDSYRAILRKLEQVDAEILSPGSLDKEELRIYRSFSGIQEEYRFEKAQARIRAQVGQRDEFIRGIIDSGQFLSEMEEIFRSYRVPVQLTRIAFVESMFNTKAYSKAHASGIFQFIPSTGRLFLRIDNLVDERNDPILATHASARLLLSNFRALDYWPLAITAYNHGVNGMRRAVQSVGEPDMGLIAQHYQSRTFGFASRNFYAQFLAALHVEANAKRYFGVLPRHEPLRVDIVRLPEHIALKTLSEYTQVAESELIELNPALSEAVMNSVALVPNDYDLRIPAGTKSQFLTAYANIPRSQRLAKQAIYHWHRVERGETLSAIARQFRTSPGSILQANSIGGPNKIYAGQLLKIPMRGQNGKALAAKPTPRPPLYVEAARAPRSNVVSPTVKLLDPPNPTPILLDAPESPGLQTNTASQVASSQPSQKADPAEVRATSVSGPARSSENLFALLDPNLGRESFRLAPEQSARLSEVGWVFHYTTQAAPRADLLFVGTTKVLEGEAPSDFASWCSISTPQLRRLNSIKFGEDLEAGQNLQLECPVSREAFHLKRLRFHRSLQEKTQKECEDLRFERHSVRSEDTLWHISRDLYHTPSWLIQKHNPALDLSEPLPQGETLLIPICGPKRPGKDAA